MPSDRPSPPSSSDFGRRFPTLIQLELTPERVAVLEELSSGGRKVDLSAGLDQVRLGPFEALLTSPQLASRTQAVGEYIRFSSSLPGAVRELAILIVARRWSSLLEWHIHDQIAQREGVPDDIREAVRQRAVVGEQGSPERDVWHFAQALLSDGHVSDGVFEAITERYGQRGALDLVATVGYYCFIAFVLNVDRFPLPPEAKPAFAAPPTSIGE